jgi:hypothetical protein
MSGNVCLCTYFIDSDLTDVTVNKDTIYIRKYKYTKKYSDSVLEISFDTSYYINAYGDDTFVSKILVGLTANPTAVLSTRHQVFKQNNGGDTRSGTVFPISGIKPELSAGDVYISISIDTNSANDSFIFRKKGLLIIREYAGFSTLTAV